MDDQVKSRQLLLLAGSFLGWLAVILQFYLILIHRVASVPETIFQYFSFFTILTNILATVCFTCLLLYPFSRWGRFFSRPATLTAITVYIVLVALVYNLVLRFISHSRGLQRLTDEILHVAVPLCVFLFWIFFVKKAELAWKAVFYWLLYPVIYIILILYRGSFSGFYPYPFSNVRNLGYPKVILNSGKIVLACLLLSLFFVWVGKWRKKRL